jgi:membrane protein
MIIRQLGLAIAVTGLLGAVVILLMGIPDPWVQFQQATCLSTETGCFCEAFRSSFVRQPVNSLTSLAFVFVGIVAFDKKRPWLNLLAASMVVTGIGSTYYHMSMTFWGQYIDVAGMHMIALLIVLFSFRGTPKIKSRFKLIYIIAFSCVAFLLYVAPETRRFLFAFLTVVGLVFEFLFAPNRRTASSYRYLICGIITMATGFIVWILDNNHTLCSPESIFQGHGFWHIAGAASALLLWKHYQLSDAGE